MELENYSDWHCLDCATCDSGQRQSPVNITDVQEGGSRPLTVDYHPIPMTPTDTGSSIRFDDPTRQNCVVYQGARYTLTQFHFHHPGEHHINQKTYAMELHLVHRHAERGFLVVAVMIEAGAQAHPAYANLWRHFPDADADPDNIIDPAALLPPAHTYYAYSGSLTTPPCSENVQWVIMTEPVALSEAQLAAYRAVYTGNNRPLQPLNGRSIFRYTDG